MSEQTVEEIVEPLLTWYNAVKRILPWRDKDNAYYTWVSEIMLQQTRVEAVKPYFNRFISRLPDIQQPCHLSGRRAYEAVGRAWIL